LKLKLHRSFGAKERRLRMTELDDKRFELEARS
jgi:hypothetical protein